MLLDKCFSLVYQSLLELRQIISNILTNYVRQHNKQIRVFFFRKYTKNSILNLY